MQNIQNRVDALPPELQRQILDYIEFIITKYQSDSDLSQEGKTFLDSRMRKMKENPQDNLEWEEARKAIHQRLGWE